MGQRQTLVRGCRLLHLQLQLLHVLLRFLLHRRELGKR
jgi:hypothetical protein